MIMLFYERLFSSRFVMLFSCPVASLIIAYMHIDIDPLCFRLFLWICISDVMDDDLLT